ncbi:MAG: pyridoxamine 5'-phosphate oxidase [Solirubrobacterales bacterium]
MGRPDMPPLHRDGLDPDPIAQFGEWYERAEADLPLADAMTLATVDPDDLPDGRMVLLKGFDARGFRFFTNSNSAKGNQLEAGSEAALVIYWRELDRQVRIRGAVEVVGEAEADEYFASRPRDSQIGAWASPQSEALDGREWLDARMRELEGRFEGGDVPRPPHWNGYRVRPREIEFWQGQKGRLHDRFRYVREGVETEGSTEGVFRGDDGIGWRIERLAP